MVGSNRHERSKMSEMDPKAKAASAQPMFVPKPDPQVNTVELTLDQCLLEIAATFREFAPLKEKLENLKTVAKRMIKDKGLRQYVHEPTGIKALFYDQNKSDINKALAKELCGSRWNEVEKFKTVTSFKVTVPGVKSPDAD
jgi:hypothetical protein